MITDERLGGETAAYGEMHLCMGNTATWVRGKAWDHGEVGCRLRQFMLFTYLSFNLILHSGCKAEHLVRGSTIADSCSSFENEILERRCLCLCMHARMQSQPERCSSWNLLSMWLVQTRLFLYIQDASWHLVISKILSCYNSFTFSVVETGSYFLGLAGLELFVDMRLASNSQSSTWFCIPRVGIKVISHHPD